MIYRAVFLSGKSYIGQSINLSKRKYAHKKSSNNINCKDFNSNFHKAIRKYGWKNIKWEILRNEIDINLLGLFEQSYIAIYDSYLSGYNMTEGRRKSP